MLGFSDDAGVDDDVAGRHADMIWIPNAVLVIVRVGL
jgi:hypothetical protein